MPTRIRAKYANGVLTPLEPLDLEDGAVVVLSLEKDSVIEQGQDKPEFRVIPNYSGFAPGVDPKKLKDIISELEIEEYLEKERKVREREK